MVRQLAALGIEEVTIIGGEAYLREDWDQIAALYTVLERVHPTPVVRLNRAAAVAMAAGPEEGLALLEGIAEEPAMERYHLFHSARADLLRRAGRHPEARTAYETALATCDNAVEREFLRMRLGQQEGT